MFGRNKAQHNDALSIPSPSIDGFLVWAQGEQRFRPETVQK